MPDAYFQTFLKKHKFSFFRVGAISSKAMQPGDTVAVTPKLI
jgi:hypothetical protein